MEKTTEVDIDLSDEMFLTLAKIAHENNITFNELVNVILRKRMMEDAGLVEEHKPFTVKEFQDHFDVILFNVTQGVYIADIYKDEKSEKPDMIMISMGRYRELMPFPD